MICEEFPAVTLPSSLKAGFRLASDSTLESGRMPSSVAKISSVSLPSSSWTAHGYQLVLEAALGGGPGGPLVALHREGVELLARDAPLVGDHLGADALALQLAVPLGVRVAGHHARPEGEAEVTHDRGAHGGVGHGLDAGGDGDVIGPRHDALGGEVDGLLGRPALAVDGGGGDRLGPARPRARRYGRC